MAAEIEQQNHWETEPGINGNRKRGKAYYKLKKKIAETIINRIDNEYNSDFSKHILFYETASPYTYLRYTANYRGTMMGAKPGKENMQNKVASYYTNVSNLLIGGQWAELGGGIPITSKAAINTSLIIMKKENKKAYKLLSDYFDGKINLTRLNSKLSITTS